MEKISEVTEKQFLEVTKFLREEIEIDKADLKDNTNKAMLSYGYDFAIAQITKFEMKIEALKTIGAID